MVLANNVLSASNMSGSVPGKSNSQMLTNNIESLCLSMLDVNSISKPSKGNVRSLARYALRLLTLQTNEKSRPGGIGGDMDTLFNRALDQISRRQSQKSCSSTSRPREDPVQLLQRLREAAKQVLTAKLNDKENSKPSDKNGTSGGSKTSSSGSNTFVSVMELLLLLANSNDGSDNNKSGHTPKAYNDSYNDSFGSPTSDIEMEASVINTAENLDAIPRLINENLEEDLLYCGFSESEILHDILYALQGVESESIEWTGEVYRMADRVSVVPAVRELVDDILYSIATDYRHITFILKMNLQSLVFDAFKQGVTESLRDYFKWIAFLETQINNGLTLRRMHIWLREPRKKMAVLADLCSVAAEHRAGGTLLSALYMATRSGDTVTTPVIKSLLHCTSKPLMDMVRLWVTEGQLRDPHGEFFVVVDSNARIENLWLSMYRVEPDRIPCFLSVHVANKILLTGKSINFIRLCCQETDWLAQKVCEKKSTTGNTLFWLDDSKGPSNRIPLLDDLPSLVESHSLSTNRHLVSLLLDKYSLLAHCSAIKKYLLLGQGDFIEAFLELADGELRKDAKTEVFRHNIRALVDLAIRQSNAQYHEAEFLDRIDVSLGYAHKGEIGWDVFWFDYAITTPLHVVFSSDAMTILQRVSTFLWKLRRANHSLKKGWVQQSIYVRHSILLNRGKGPHPTGNSTTTTDNIRAHLDGCNRRVDSIRNVLSHVMQNVQSYVLYEVLETAHYTLEKALEGAKDLDEVLYIYHKYLRVLEACCFLVSGAEKIHETLSKIFRLTFLFEQMQEQVSEVVYSTYNRIQELDDTNRAYKRIHDDENEGSGSGSDTNSDDHSDDERLRQQPSRAGRKRHHDDSCKPSLEEISHMNRELEAMDSEVNETVGDLLHHLNQPRSEYGYLLCRLNFNDYFVRQ